MTGRDRRLPAVPLGLVLLLALVLLVVLSTCAGDAGWRSPAVAMRAGLALLGMAEPLPGLEQRILENRLWDALCASGVGASLALSGGLVQGVFRNGLASPSLLGVTGGASLGAVVGILLLGGYLEGPLLGWTARAGSALLPLFGFAGAAGAAFLVALLATRGGRISVPTLLLLGIAINMCTSGILALIVSSMLEDWDVARAIMDWTFGTLRDRSPFHVGTVWVGLALSAVALPFVAAELDLFRGGEEDAQALGVDTGRVKVLALVAAALSAASAVAVAGQIAFVGLVVPHLLRLISGPGHRSLLPLCILGGAVFLVGADFAQVMILGSSRLQPGVLMSVFGGPFFLFLLIRSRREVGAW